jgi:hypothetical protein
MSNQKHPAYHINRQIVRWWRVVNASPSLKARLRELADEATEGLAIELGGPKPDGLMRLTAGMIVLTVRTAREEAIRLIEHGASTKQANAAFLCLDGGRAVGGWATPCAGWNCVNVAFGMKRDSYARRHCYSRCSPRRPHRAAVPQFVMISTSVRHTAASSSPPGR